MHRPPDYFKPLGDPEHPFLATVGAVALEDVAEIERQSKAAKAKRDLDAAKSEKTLRDLMSKRRRAAKGAVVIDSAKVEHDAVRVANAARRTAERERRKVDPDAALRHLLRVPTAGTPQPGVILRHGTSTTFAAIPARDLVASLQAFDRACDEAACHELFDRILEERPDVIS